MTEPLHAHLVGPEAALGGLRLRGRVGHGQIQGQGARVLEMLGKHGEIERFPGKNMAKPMEKWWISGQNMEEWWNNYGILGETVEKRWNIYNLWWER